MMVLALVVLFANVPMLPAEVMVAFTQLIVDCVSSRVYKTAKLRSAWPVAFKSKVREMLENKLVFTENSAPWVPIGAAEFQPLAIPAPAFLALLFPRMRHPKDEPLSVGSVDAPPDASTSQAAELPGPSPPA